MTLVCIKLVNDECRQYESVLVIFNSMEEMMESRECHWVDVIPRHWTVDSPDQLTFEIKNN